MARFFYTLLFYIAVPVVLLRLLLRSTKAPDYRRRWLERFGFVPPIAKSSRVIWVHAVSVGETLAAVPLIKALQSKYPEAQLMVTTTTPTGSARVKAAFGDSVYHTYAPYDLTGSLARFLARTQPAILVIMETELWPNMIYSCSSRGIPIVVANARLSEKSFGGYAKFEALSYPMLRQVSSIAAQHIDDAQRFLKLGLNESQLNITGNIKFDLNIEEPLRAKASELRQQWQGEGTRPIFLVASTHRGEDEIILEAFRSILEQQPNVLLVLVPRHPERFDEVAALCQQKEFSVLRRSELRAPSAHEQILLGDSMGELLVFFGASDIAFVGGSLVPVGGHNMIEPASWGIPVLSGPHVFNFSEASQLLLAEGGMAICESANEISQQALRLLVDEGTAKAMGIAAKQVAENNRGALKKLLEVIACHF